eukprot:g23121.t1
MSLDSEALFVTLFTTGRRLAKLQQYADAERCFHAIYFPSSPFSALQRRAAQVAACQLLLKALSHGALPPGSNMQQQADRALKKASELSQAIEESFPSSSSSSSTTTTAPAATSSLLHLGSFSSSASAASSASTSSSSALAGSAMSRLWQTQLALDSLHLQLSLGRVTSAIALAQHWAQLYADRDIHSLATLWRAVLTHLQLQQGRPQAECQLSLTQATQHLAQAVAEAAAISASPACTIPADLLTDYVNVLRACFLQRCGSKEPSAPASDLPSLPTCDLSSSASRICTWMASEERQGLQLLLQAEHVRARARDQEMEGVDSCFRPLLSALQPTHEQEPKAVLTADHCLFRAQALAASTLHQLGSSRFLEAGDALSSLLQLQAPNTFATQSPYRQVLSRWLVAVYLTAVSASDASRHLLEKAKTQLTLAKELIAQQASVIPAELRLQVCLQLEAMCLEQPGALGRLATYEVEAKSLELPKYVCLSKLLQGITLCLNEQYNEAKQSLRDALLASSKAEQYNPFVQAGAASFLGRYFLHKLQSCSPDWHVGQHPAVENQVESALQHSLLQAAKLDNILGQIGALSPFKAYYASDAKRLSKLQDYFERRTQEYDTKLGQLFSRPAHVFLVAWADRSNAFAPPAAPVAAPARSKPKKAGCKVQSDSNEQPPAAKRKKIVRPTSSSSAKASTPASAKAPSSSLSSLAQLPQTPTTLALQGAQILTAPGAADYQAVFNTTPQQQRASAARAKNRKKEARAKNRKKEVITIDLANEEEDDGLDSVSSLPGEHEHDLPRTELCLSCKVMDTDCRRSTSGKYSIKTGSACININRRKLFPLGPDPAGPVDFNFSEVLTHLGYCLLMISGHQ